MDWLIRVPLFAKPGQFVELGPPLTVIGSLNPLIPIADTPYVADPCDVTSWSDGAIWKVKSCTANVAEAERFIAPLCPVTENVDVPCLTAAACNVIVVCPDPTIVAGLKVACAPPGNPTVAKLTFPLKPFIGFTFTV